MIEEKSLKRDESKTILFEEKKITSNIEDIKPQGDIKKKRFNF